MAGQSSRAMPAKSWPSTTSTARWSARPAPKPRNCSGLTASIAADSRQAGELRLAAEALQRRGIVAVLNEGLRRVTADDVLSAAVPVLAMGAYPFHITHDRRISTLDRGGVQSKCGHHLW